MFVQKIMESMKPSPKPALASDHGDKEHHRSSHHIFSRQKRHTKTQYKTLAPQWNETFDFEINRHKEMPKHGPAPHEVR